MLSFKMVYYILAIALQYGFLLALEMFWNCTRLPKELQDVFI